MSGRKLKNRVGILLSIMGIMLVIFSAELYNMQIVKGNQYNKEGSTNVQTVSVTAARGSILDKNGNSIVSSRAGYNVVFNSYVLNNSSDVNGTILKLINICEENGIKYNDELPISDTDYQYTFDSSGSTAESNFRQYLTYKGWDSDISAANMIKLMKTQYKIDSSYSEEISRKIIGIRYSLDLRNAVSTSDYVFAKDISTQMIAKIKEPKLQGVTIQTVMIRNYDINCAAHILGRTGLMNEEEYSTYKNEGYSMNAQVGKDGLEKVYEEYLHGTDGTEVVSTSKDGRIVESNYKKTPVPGDNVYLTIDANMQQIAEKSLASCIDNLHKNGTSEGDGTDAEGGAVVVMNVNDGSILTSASYPTYNLSTFNDDYTKLSNDKLSPLFNRALMAAYAPGSTYKMVTTVAAINNGVISPYTQILDKGIYTYYKDYQPRCSLYNRTGRTHGLINVEQAIAVSCNYFFYDTGRRTGIEKIDETAKELGLGESTGVELAENTGRRANPTTRKALTGDEWYGGDTLQAAIGQSDNLFSPLQLACYVSTLANGGTRYAAHFLDKIVTSDGKTVKQYTPTVLGKANISATAYKTVKDGMLMTSRSSTGTASSTFGDYPIDVCSKTGTAQHSGSGSDNALFVCFAPYDNPQIAIVVVVEKGGQGGALANVAKDIMNYYFKLNTGDSEEETGN